MTTKTSTTLHEGILKNVERENPNTGQALAEVIRAEANQREHLNGAVLSAAWDAQHGINVLVKDAGHRQHLANAIGLPPTVVRLRGGKLQGDARTGVFLGYRVNIWNLATD